MSTLKQSFTQTLDISTNAYATGDTVSMNILNKEVYSLTINIREAGVALDLTPFTIEFLDGAIVIPHTVTDAANGIVDIVFDDVSTYTVNKSIPVTIKFTEGTVERVFYGFKMSFFTIP